MTIPKLTPIPVNRVMSKLSAYLLVWLVFVTASWHFPAQAESSLVVAIPNNGYAPFIILNPTSPSGILIKPLEQAAKKIELNIEYVYLPEKRSRKMLEAGLIDARMESKKWVSAPGHYYWSLPIVQLEDVLVYHKLTPLIFHDVEDLAGSQLVTHLGYTYPTIQPLFRTGRASRIDRTSELEMLTALLRPDPDDVKAAIMNIDVAKWLIAQDPKLHNQFRFSSKLVDSAPLQFQFYKSARLESIVTRLNIELASILQTSK